MRAILLSVGDELTLGQTVDTNSAWLAARMAEQGVAVHAHQTVADDRRAIELAIRWAAHNAELVVVTGGLGPTDDDLTRQALADAMDRPLIEDKAALDQIAAFFTQRGRPMPKTNAVQARHPAGSALIRNPNGTAPGIRAHIDRGEVFALPGVPGEMRSMYRDAVEPALSQISVGQGIRGGRGVILTTKINTFGHGESDIAELLGDRMSRGQNPTIGTTVSDGIVSVRIRAESDDAEQARHAIAAAAEDVEATLGPIAFGRDDTTLGQAVIDALVSRRCKLATAESCTGGLIGAMLTDVPGSSAAYAGGWVTYTNAMKTRQLGVKTADIQQHGAVSGPVVRAMAEGALTAAEADLAVSVSGIAGPDGGGPDKPVGTVWLGLAWRVPDGSAVSEARLAMLRGDRLAIRDRAAKCALQWVRLHLLSASTDLIQWMGSGIRSQESGVRRQESA